MSPGDEDAQMRVGTLYRYPVKSMLGEAVDALFVDEQGVENDRRLALIDEATGRVASAKQARLWRALLTCSARVDAGRVSIRLPDGTTVTADEDGIDGRLSKLLARQVHLAHSRPPGASIERAVPEQVLEFGLDAEVEAPLLELAEATPGTSFTDYAPVHAITTATLERIGIEAERYRPNLVIVTPTGFPPYTENDWTGRTLAVGEARLRSLGPTPRCIVPTLEHGELAQAPQALRTPAVENRVAALDMGELPCAGAYFEVVAAGTVQVGDRVSLGA
ncbi:MOSC N-terminal beta barrel domain-containing protein [Mycolicibacterium sp.]|uniref:MOSC domain-containing protein n=1 Tax=Mycolicibacterium sp. TaxID=2320850 RepID=UPI001A2705C7|nr:MOSC N-terminal beta barrel domain-containing protein [Mycolicibacterium sp.]MBJ7336661.1 MOSC domain-containing protein [Mycolicibacterium sp.]